MMTGVLLLTFLMNYYLLVKDVFLQVKLMACKSINNINNNKQSIDAYDVSALSYQDSHLLNFQHYYAYDHRAPDPSLTH